MADLDDHSLEHGSIRERLTNIETRIKKADKIGDDYTRVKYIGYGMGSLLIAIFAALGFLINVYIKTQS